MTFQRYWRELGNGQALQGSHKAQLADRLGVSLASLSNAARDPTYATKALRKKLVTALGPGITFEYEVQRCPATARVPSQLPPSDTFDSSVDDTGAESQCDAMKAAMTDTIVEVLATVGIKIPKARPSVFQAVLADVPQYATAVSLSDIQIPHADWDVLDVVLAFIKAHHFDYVFLNGDIFDFAPLSDFTPSPFLIGTFESHRVQGLQFLKRVRSENPNATIIFIPGNHEYRLTRYLMNRAPELKELEALTIEELFDFEELGITMKSTGLIDNYCKFGDLYVAHWARVRKHPGWTVKSLMEDYGASFVQGHVHRCAVVPKYLLEQTLIGIEQGCLCDLHPQWKMNPHWEHGFATILKDGTHCDADLVRIQNGRFVYQGQVWSTTPLVKESEAAP